MPDNTEVPLSNTAIPESVMASLRKQGGLAALMDSIPGDEDLEREASTYKSLSDPVRLKIVHSLRHGGLCPCILKELTGTTDSGLSYHLSKLEDSGLVAYDKEKNWRIYRLTDLGRIIIEHP